MELRNGAIWNYEMELFGITKWSYFLSSLFVVTFLHNIKIDRDEGVRGVRRYVFLNVAQFAMYRDLIIKQVCLFG